MGVKEINWPKIQIEKNLTEDMEVRKAIRPKYSLYTRASSGSKKKLSTEDKKTSQEDCSMGLGPSHFSDWVKLKKTYAWVCHFCTTVDYQVRKDQQEN